MLKHQYRIIAAGMVGNLVEAFDIAICGLFSIYFAKYLIGDSEHGLLIILLTFFAGYLARPLGAVFLGLFSDKYGRKITLALSILLMGLATAFIGFIPSNKYIGMHSITMLLILRIIQSFFCGAEYLNSSTYLVENAENSSKGFIGSWASFGAMAGLLIAFIISFISTSYILKYPELEWLIWRAPFILCLIGSFMGLYIRLRIPESLDYIIYYSEHEKPRFKDVIKNSYIFIRSNKLQAFYAFVLSILGVTSTFMIYIYSPMFSKIYANFSYQQSVISNIISLIVMLSVFPIAGKLSDKLNREYIVVISLIGFGMLFIPYFNALAYGGFYNLLIIQCAISIFAGAYYAVVPVMLSQMFPLQLRCTVLSFLYSIAASLASGITPVLSMLLINKTHSPISPALIIYLLICILFGLTYKQAKNSKRNLYLAYE